VKFTGNPAANHFQWAKLSNDVSSRLTILPIFHLLLYVSSHAHEALHGKGNFCLNFIARKL
jgi:hypothetical protein